MNYAKPVVDLIARIVLHGWKEVARAEVSNAARVDVRNRGIGGARPILVCSREAEVVGNGWAQDGRVLRDSGVGAILFRPGSAERASIDNRERSTRGDGVIRIGVAEIEPGGDAAAIGQLIVQ